MMKKTKGRFDRIRAGLLILAILLTAATGILVMNTPLKAPEGTWNEDVYEVKAAVSSYPEVELEQARKIPI